MIPAAVDLAQPPTQPPVGHAARPAQVSLRTSAVERRTRTGYPRKAGLNWTLLVVSWFLLAAGCTRTSTTTSVDRGSQASSADVAAEPPREDSVSPKSVPATGPANGPANGNSSASQTSGELATERAKPVDLHGQPIDLQLPAADAGATDSPRWTVLVFVQGDCPIANQYVPALNELRQEFLTHGVRWIHVYPDPDETAEVVTRHVSEYQVVADVVRDPQHIWVDRYQVRVTPEVVVLDSQGEVRYQGRIDDRFRDFGQGRRSPRRQDLREALSSLVADQPVAVTQTEAVGCLIIDLK